MAEELRHYRSCALARSGLGADARRHAGMGALHAEPAWFRRHLCPAVLLDDDRRSSLLKTCREQPELDAEHYSEKEIFERLLKLRKAAKLKVDATKRSDVDVTDDRVAAEIASRWISDQYGLHTDQWLIDSDYLSKFDRAALEIAPDSTAYRLRKAALQLRKARKLRPELTTRVVDWKREIITYSVSDARDHVKQLPTNAGIYIFRDKSGYLYVGQSNNLRTRLTKHLEDSDRKTLSAYLASQSDSEITIELHVFAKDSPAIDTTIREAYESELIRTRHPRFNVAP